MSKLIGSVKQAIEKTGLKDGMTISFHHHMRNGDYVLNMVLEDSSSYGNQRFDCKCQLCFRCT